MNDENKKLVTWDEVLNAGDLGFSFEVTKPGKYYLLPDPHGFMIHGPHSMGPFYVPPEDEYIILDEEFDQATLDFLNGMEDEE